MIPPRVVGSWCSSAAAACESVLRHSDSMTEEQYRRIQKAYTRILEVERELLTGMPCPEGSLDIQK